jgi:hypothetical protein
MAAWLYLFSSNASPQYAQDILNVFACASGQEYVFRYEKRWVEPTTREKWLTLADKQTSTLGCFSLQQRAFFQDPAFIPVRLAQVVATTIIGSHYFVRMRVGNYVTLPQARSFELEDFAEPVRAFTAYIKSRCTTPYAASACLGKQLRDKAVTPEVRIDRGPQEILFERTTEYLGRTESFEAARFLRLAEVVPRDRAAASVPLEGWPPAFSLEAGKTYEVRLLQNQPQLITDRRQFTVGVDGTVLDLLGEPRFDIASSYDQIVIDIHARVPKQFSISETVVVIEPADEGLGPRIEVPCRVVASAKRAASVTAATTLGLTLIGAQTVLPVSHGLKAVLVVVGAFVAAYLQMYGFGRPTPPEPTSWPP